MSRLAFGLLCLVALTHSGYLPLAQIWGHGTHSAEVGWFYVLRGVEGALLFLLVWRLAPRSAAVSLACLWGFAEEAQTAACRLAVGFDSVPPLPPGQTLCGALTGLPPYTMPIVLAGLLWLLRQADQPPKL